MSQMTQTYLTQSMIGRAVYSGVKEEIPHDIPEPKGKYVTTTTYVDANLHHDHVTGRAVTACLYLVNATPTHWYTKRQHTVETATFGSEFVTARIATDQIIDLRYTLMYLGVPVRAKSYMFWLTTNLWLTVQAYLLPPYANFGFLS